MGNVAENAVENFHFAESLIMLKTSTWATSHVVRFVIFLYFLLLIKLLK